VLTNILNLVENFQQEKDTTCQIWW